MKKKLDHICGIDRYQHSGYYGIQVLEVVILWNKAKAAMAREGNVSGALAHGAEVEILRERTVSKLTFSLVEETKPPNEQKPQKGWVRNTLLLKAGLKEEGIKAVDSK